MASPSLVNSSAMALDPNRQARFTLQLGESLTTQSGTKRKYSAVRFNHKPRQSGSSRTTHITSNNSSAAALSIHDDNSGVYKYKGQHKLPTNTYVLIFDPNKQSCTLEALSSSYSFNLHSTPSESSASALRSKYPHIPTEEEDKPRDATDDLFDEDSGGETGPRNPYDYRNFRDASVERSISRSPSPALPAPSPRPASSTAKQGATQDPQRSRAKPATKPQILKRSKPKPAKPAAVTPTVRLERRATTLVDQETTASKAKPKTKAPPKSAEFVHDSSSSSSPDLLNPSPLEVSQEAAPSSLSAAGGLEIDFGDAGPPVKKSASAVLRGTPLLGATDGPISLRSAANSPRSLANTPRARSRLRGGDDDAGLEIDLGEASGYGEDDEDEDAEMQDAAEPPPHKRSSNTTTTTTRLETHHEATDEDDEPDAEGEIDLDVEPMSIGPPAHAKEVASQSQASQLGGGANGAQEQEQDDDDDDDMDAAFEAEMMQGLEDDEEEESEVSEAE